MVGVIVPVHGFAPYLAEALDSVLEQVPAPDAVVVVDDGSDEPLELHPDHAGRCTLVRRDDCGGPAAARASGLSELAAGIDLVALCDADDAWATGKLAAQLDMLERFADAALCFGRALVVGPDGRPTGERWEEVAAGAHAGGEMLARLYAANPIATSSVVVRRAALEAAGGFASPLRLAEDWDLWLRLAGGDHAFISEPRAVVRYRRHPGGLTADVAALARCQLELHRRHGGSVTPDVRERALSADEAALRSTRRRRLRRLVPRRDPYR